jgi:3-methyladenine DNA glycosylase AlkD
MEVEKKTTPAKLAAEIRIFLKRGGSEDRARGVQRFFKEEIQSRGWRTADLRRVSLRLRREILRQYGLSFLLDVADRLFAGAVNEEKNVAVFLLENMTGKFQDAQFKLLESWLPRISNWSDHDALVHYVIAPMMVAKPLRANKVFRWAESPNRWFRRAACVALIQGARRKMFLPQIICLSDRLLSDEDDMVRKGLGWLLREAAKADPENRVPYLMRISKAAPRLVLRTACETLSTKVRKRILA